MLDWEDKHDLAKEFWISIKGSLKEKVNSFCLIVLYMCMATFFYINISGNCQENQGRVDIIIHVYYYYFNALFFCACCFQI